MPLLVADDIITPTLFAQAGQQVLDGAVGIVRALLVPATVTPGERVPDVRNRQIVDTNEEAWAAQLRSARHLVGVAPNQVEKVHSIQIGWGGSDTYDARTVGRKGFRIRLTFAHYYEDEIGTDADNADRAQAAEIAQIQYALYDSRFLGSPGLVHRVFGWRETRALRTISVAVVRRSLGEFWAELQPVPMPVH